MMFRLLLILCLGHCLPAVLGSELASVAEIGGSVTLHCDGLADTENKEVLWKFKGKLACWIKNGNWCEAGHYVNRTRLGSIRRNNFFLAINPVREEDAGVYLCRINREHIGSIRLIVKGGRKRRDAVTAGEGRPFCRPYREREDPPGSETKDKQDFDENLSGLETKDKQDSDENPAGRKREMIGVTVVLMVTMAVALVLFKRNRQRAKKLPDLGPSEDALINGASVHAGESSADKKMEEPAV